MQIGDKILIVIRGPHGCGLVQAVVDHVYAPVSHRHHFETFVAGDRESCLFATEDEGLTWTRGHDAAAPEACALLTAAAL